jgi:hypothetical protein
MMAAVPLRSGSGRVCDGFLDDVKLDIELVSGGGINEGEDASG